MNASIYVSLALLKLNERADPGYVYRYSQSPAFVRDVEKRSLLNAAPKKINMGDIGGILIPVPSKLAEQQAIATALGDIDDLIGAQDRLIAKKRDIKQAAMQQLLTGRQRLPGFKCEWTMKRFGKLFNILRTAHNPRSDLSDFGTVGYVHYGDIHMTVAAFLDCSQRKLPLIAASKVSSLPRLEDGDLVMADASEDYDGIGKSIEIRGIAGKPIVAGLHTFLLRGDKQQVADGFKAYLQFVPSVRTALIRSATGISVYGISKNNVRSIEVQLPPLEEQRAIAAVLSNMDAEIAMLEQRRDKIRALRQGMMQELLTGRTRLV